MSRFLFKKEKPQFEINKIYFLSFVSKFIQIIEIINDAISMIKAIIPKPKLLSPIVSVLGGKVIK